MQRQYIGTAGHIENAQVAVYLLYATDAGARHDRPGAVSAPRLDQGSGTLGDRGCPDQVGFATKPALATAMLARALDARVPAAWVTGHEVYGTDPGLLAELEGRGIGYVLAVACDHRLLAAGDTYRADALLWRVPARAWQWVSAGRGAKGHRYYDWAFIQLDHGDPSPGGQARQRWLLVRRNRKTGELAFYHCWTPRPVAPATLTPSWWWPP